MNKYLNVRMCDENGNSYPSFFRMQWTRCIDLWNIKHKFTNGKLGLKNYCVRSKKISVCDLKPTNMKAF